MSLMYTELSDMGGDLELPPMAPFAVRESNLAIGRGDSRGGYTQPEQRNVAHWMDDRGLAECSDNGTTKPNRESAGASSVVVVSEGLEGREGRGARLTGNGNGATSHLTAVRNRGIIAPVSPMLSFGAEMPLAVFVVLVLNAIMMLLCAIALLSRGARSA